MNKLVAPEGYYYTQVAEVAPADRIFSVLIFLGDLDSPENWRLVSEAEKREWEAEHEND